MSELKERNLKFETLQLHVGQEQFQYMLQLHMFSITRSTPQIDLHLKMQVTFMADLLTQHKMFLSRELQLLRVV